MIWTPEMEQLAKTVLEKKDPSGAAALADCVSEQFNQPDFRFSVAYVEKLEQLLRKYVIYFREKVEEAGSAGWIEIDVDLLKLMLLDHTKIEMQVRQQFGRDLG